MAQVAAQTDWDTAFPSVGAMPQDGDWDAAFPAVTPHPAAGPSGSLLTDAGRFAGTAGANAMGALLSLPHSAAQGIDWLGDKVGVNPGATPAIESVKDPSGSGQPLFPDFGTARNMAFNTTGGTEYQPQTWLGRRGMDAATGAILGATGGLGAIPAAAGGSATGGAAAEVFPNHPLAAAMLGFIPGAAIANGAMTAPQRLAGALLKSPETEPYGAFNRLDLPTDLAGTTTGAPMPAYAEKLAARMPGSEGMIADARGNLVNAWQDKLDSTASKLGSAATPQELGTSLQTAAQKWLGDFKSNTSDLWNKFHAMVPGETPVGVSNYQAALDNVLGNFSGAPETGAVLQPGTVQKLSDALGVDLKSNAVPPPGAPPGPLPPTLPWQAIKSMRTAIGEKLESPSIVSDTSQAALKQLYGGLTDDMKAGAAGVGPAASTAFDTANAATRAGHELLDTQIGPILKANNPEQAAQYAMSQARLGGSRLDALATNLPGAAGDLGSFALRNAAGNVENPSPTGLATALTGRKPIYSQEAQRVLFPDQGTQQTVADLASTGNAMKPFEKDLANSPTATHQTRGLGRVIAAAELARQGHELLGTPGAIAGGAAGFFAPDLMGRVARTAALNPTVASIYGRNIPFVPSQPSLLARAMMAPALGSPGLAPVTATSASSVPLSQ